MISLGSLLDTFKEVEAQKQVLLMVHEHLSTNIKRGATYAMEDLRMNSMFAFALSPANPRSYAIESLRPQILCAGLRGRETVL